MTASHPSQTSSRNLFPVFRGNSFDARVIDRDLLMKSTLHARSPRIQVDVDGSITGVDFKLVTELEGALKDNLFASQLMDNSVTLKRQKICDKSSEGAISIPMYVNLIEEITYKEKKAASGHLYTQIRELFRHSNMRCPSVHEVQLAYKVLQVRWLRNEYVYGYPGLLIRYEVFVTKYLRDQLLKGFMPKVSEELIENLTQHMRQCVAGSHVHFPSRKEIEIAAWVKTKALLRLRRRRMKEYANAMRWLVQQQVFIDPHDLAAIALSVCKQNGHDDIITFQDLKRWAVSIVAGQCHAIAKKFDGQYTAYLDKLREDETSTNPHKMLHFKAYSWLADYELANGSMADTDADDDEC